MINVSGTSKPDLIKILSSLVSDQSRIEDNNILKIIIEDIIEDNKIIIRVR